MSDIHPHANDLDHQGAGISRRREWQSLRLLIVPDVATQLLVSLVIVPRNGHPRLHPQIRTLVAAWDPALRVPDDTLYALSQALAAVNQTRY